MSTTAVRVVVVDSVERRLPPAAPASSSAAVFVDEDKKKKTTPIVHVPATPAVVRSVDEDTRTLKTSVASRADLEDPPATSRRTVACLVAIVAIVTAVACASSENRDVLDLLASEVASVVDSNGPLVVETLRDVYDACVSFVGSSVRSLAASVRTGTVPRSLSGWWGS